MNEQIKKLAGWAGLTNTLGCFWQCGDDAIERLVEIVRAEEQASCAKLLDDFAKTEMVPAKDTWRMGVMAAANAVRDKK